MICHTSIRGLNKLLTHARYVQNLPNPTLCSCKDIVMGPHVGVASYLIVIKMNGTFSIKRMVKPMIERTMCGIRVLQICGHAPIIATLFSRNGSGSSWPLLTSPCIVIIVSLSDPLPISSIARAWRRLRIQVQFTNDCKIKIRKINEFL